MWYDVVMARAYTQETKTAAIKDYESGMASKAVAEKYDASHQNLHLWLKEAGVTIRPKLGTPAKYSKEQITQAIELRKAGTALSEITTKVGIPLASLKFHLAQNDIKITREQRTTNVKATWAAKT